MLTTKVGMPMGEDPNHQGGSRRWITTAVESSLRRLGTDYIDIYQLQRPDPTTDLEETLSVMTDLVRAGKVRVIGSSTTPASMIVGMGTFVWGPFGQGLLTGRVRKGGENDLKRAQFFRHLNDERRLDVVEQLVPLAEEAGLPMTHLAMAFATAHPGVTAALLGPRTMAHLDDLLAGADVVLTDDVLDRIDEIVPPGTDVGSLDQEYTPPALQDPHLRRRPVTGRSVT